MLVVADHNRRFAARNLAYAQRRVLEHGVLGEEGQKLLREQLARRWPQPAAGSAGENDWNKGTVHWFGLANLLQDVHSSGGHLKGIVRQGKQAGRNR